MIKTWTNCKECVFRKGQICSLNRHENFVKNKGILTEKDGFPVVENRFCSAFRTEDWSKDKNNLEIEVRKEILIRTHVFIYSKDWKLSDIKTTVKSLKKQMLPPSGVTMIGKRDKSLIDILPKLYSLGDVVASIDESYNIYNCLDAAINKCSGQFYILIESGYKLDSRFLANIDEKINEKLEQFLAISGNDNDGFKYGCNIAAHVKYGGNADGKLVEEDKEMDFIGKTLIQKLEYTAKENNQECFIKHCSEFIND